MAKGRSKFLWHQTASIMCIIANVNRDPKKKPSPYEPTDFYNPEPTKPAEPPPKIKMRDLKGLVPALAELAKQTQQRTPTLTERIGG